MKEPIFEYRMTEYDKSILPSRFLAFLEEGVTGASQWVVRSGRSLGHPGWGLVYHLLLCVMDSDGPNVVIETGTNLGSTAILAAQAIKDSKRPGHVHTIEIDAELRDAAVDRIALSGVEDLITSHLGDSIEVLGRLLPSMPSVRVAFLDGNHLHDHVISEFEQIKPHLDRDALVIFDNTYLIAEDGEDPRVNGALRTIVSAHGGNLVNLPYCSWYTPGIAIWQRQPFEDMSPPAERESQS